MSEQTRRARRYLEEAMSAIDEAACVHGMTDEEREACERARVATSDVRNLVKQREEREAAREEGEES